MILLLKMFIYSYNNYLLISVTIFISMYIYICIYHKQNDKNEYFHSCLLFMITFQHTKCYIINFILNILFINISQTYLISLHNVKHKRMIISLLIIDGNIHKIPNFYICIWGLILFKKPYKELFLLIPKIFSYVYKWA